MYSAYTKKSLAAGSTPDPAGGAHDAPQTPKLDPDGSLMWRSHITTCAFGARVSYYGA